LPLRRSRKAPGRTPSSRFKFQLHEAASKITNMEVNL
jgi:hypothetical protein